MSNYRERDHQEYESRSGRFYQKDGSDWYLQTREGIELGPFETHAEAAVCLNEYLDFVNDRRASKVDLQQFYKNYAAA